MLSDEEAITMSIAYKLNMLAICAAFAFVGAMIFGMF